MDGNTLKTGLTPADYVTRAAFERECRERLATGWIPVCRSEDVAGVGAQKAVSVAQARVLVVRDQDGDVGALSNVCRHRSMILVEDSANGTGIRCPYHLWTYALDGSIVAAPFMEGVDVADCDLPRYAAAEWGGWVFVNLDGRAPPLGQALASLETALPPARLAEWCVGFRLAFQHDWNWKVMLENFAESYHHIGVHTQTLQPMWPGGRSDSTGGDAGRIELHHSVHPDAGTFTVHVAFPLFMLAVSDPAQAAYWYRMAPTGPERIELEIVGLFPAEAAADAPTMEAAKAQLLAIHLEDIPVCQGVQAGLRSPAAVLGPLSHLEEGLARFRRWVEA